MIFNLHILFDRVLESFPLPVNATLHLVAQFGVDFEVLHLQLHIPLLLRVDQLRYSADVAAPLLIVDALRGNASVGQTFVQMAPFLATRMIKTLYSCRCRIGSGHRRDPLS